MVQVPVCKAGYIGSIPIRISMDIQTYLEDQLKNAGKYQFTSDDKTRAEEDVVSFALKKLLSKKFRKWKLSSECIERTQKALEIQVKKNEPIRVIFFQGGYKLWRFPTSPMVDWAEFFNVAYVLNYIAPLARAYKPGVKLIYYCHTLLMETHDNLTTEEIQAYMNSFSFLQKRFQEYLPKNIEVSILKDSDIYSRDEYFKALEVGKVKAEQDIKTWTQERLKDFHRMATLNIKWKGKEDWSKLSEKQKQEKIHQAALYEQAAVNNLPKVMEIVKADNNILLFTKVSPIFIGIGSTYASIAKYWVGTGVLEKHNDAYLPRILTPSQYEKVKAIQHETLPVDLNLGENFKTIDLYSESLQFGK